MRLSTAFRLKYFLPVAAVITMAAPCLAQSAAPPHRTVIRYTVKPDRMADFRAAFKEFAELKKSNGSERYYTVWQSLTGLRQFVVVANRANWAELDEGPDPKLNDKAGAATAITDRIMQTVDSMERSLEDLQPDHSLALPSEIPAMASVVEIEVRPEHVDDFLALLKSTFLGAAKKAGLKTYLVHRTQFGGPRSKLTTVTGIDKWSDLDGTPPIVRAMGNDGYQAFLKKALPMLERSVQFDVYRHEKELSYPPPSRMMTSSK